ncbi:MAG: HDIG domain-containing protein [Saprospiraceae bacterium]|nr:HDIG domain-containing protein [Saprospiraceae bacterium]
MSKLYRRIRENQGDIAKYALVLLTIFLLSLLFPDNVRFKYDYQIGQLWNHGDLSAPFDFAILKPDSLVQSEMDAVAAEMGVFYSRDETLPSIATQSFGDDLNRIIQNLGPGDYPDLQQQPTKYIEVGKQILQQIYSDGIVARDSTNQERVVKVVEENIVSTLEPHSIEEVGELLKSKLQNSGLHNASLLFTLLERQIQPNINADPVVTQKFLETAQQKISRTKGLVQEGDLVISGGAIISEDAARRLDSFKIAYESQISENKSYWVVFGGYLLLTCLIVGVYLFYLQYHNREVFKSARKLLFMLMWLPLFGYLVHVVETNGTLSAYMIPFCIAPIVIKTFYNDRLALFSLIVIVLVASFLSSLGYEFTFLQILAGIVTVLSNHITRYWSTFFNSILLILLTYCLGYLGLALIVEGDLKTIEWSLFTWFFINVVLTFLAYPLVPLLERIFGFTSSITLSELSDVNKPLLKDLSMQAPGTFQHSLQVGNLAEAAAEEIGADSLLVKVAALYHDIGKVAESEIFIENQSAHNPHDHLSPLESAQKIIEHVPNGVAMAKKHRLPKEIIDLIWTHHGTTRVEYFYQAAFKEGNLPVDAHEQFQYPGPRPSTKEQAILMLADSLEAASKSLKDPSESSINELVDKIIAYKMEKSQLDNADLSFRELEMIRSSFKKVLKSIYHIRVEYPEPVENSANISSEPI